MMIKEIINNKLRITEEVVTEFIKGELEAKKEDLLYELLQLQKLIINKQVKIDDIDENLKYFIIKEEIKK